MNRRINKEIPAMFKRSFTVDGHCIVYVALAIVYAAAACHLGGEVVAGLCDGAAAIGYGILGWWHRRHGPVSASASRDEARSDGAH